MADTWQYLEAVVCQLRHPGALDGDQLAAVPAQGDQGGVRQVYTGGDAEIVQCRTALGQLGYSLVGDLSSLCRTLPT